MRAGWDAKKVDRHIAQWTTRGTAELKASLERRLGRPLRARDVTSMRRIQQLGCLMRVDLQVWEHRPTKDPEHAQQCLTRGILKAVEENWPTLNVLRVGGTRFALIRNLPRFLKLWQCKLCTRLFQCRANLTRHLAQSRCPVQRFAAQHPESQDPATDYFCNPDTRDSMMTTFQAGRYRCRESLLTRLQDALLQKLPPGLLELQKHCLSYDLETSQSKATRDETGDQTSVGLESTHQILCISVATDIPEVDFSLCVFYVCASKKTA